MEQSRRHGETTTTTNSTSSLGSRPHGTFEYGFDGNSNRTPRTVDRQTTGSAYNGADQITVAGATTYAYDQNGNLTATSAGPTLAYNAKDQGTSYTAPGVTGTTAPMEYLDTGQFERIQAGGTTFSTGPLGLASSTDAAVVSTNYVRDSNGGLVARKDLLGTQYYLFDRLGSVVALTDASGSAVNTYVYDPYGNHLAGTTEAVANPWQFAGGFKDAFSGYYKFGTRYYDPTIGRWTQPDPSGFEANSYAYAAGNPVNFVDPTGMFWDQVKAGFNKAKKAAKSVDWAKVGRHAWTAAGVGLTAAAIAGSGGTVLLAAGAVYSAGNIGMNCHKGFDSGCGLALASAGFGAGGTATTTFIRAKNVSDDLISLGFGASTAMGVGSGITGTYECAVELRC